MRQNCADNHRQRMLVRVTLLPSAYHHAEVRVWQRKSYDINLWTAKKLEEKQNFLQNDPVKRGLLPGPGDWPWSSWRYCFLQDASLLAMGRVP